MNVREWSLILFTILSQMAVGSFLVLGFVHFLAARKAGMKEADRLSDRALLAIGPVLVLAFISSFFHLGNPFNAYRAILNPGTSWLSREILFGVLFAVLGGVFAIMQWRKLGGFALRNAIAWIAALVGIAFVYSMSNVYLLPTQPAWNTLATPILFFTTTLLLGALAMGVAFVSNYAYLKGKAEEELEVQVSLLRDSLRWIAIASVILLGIEFVVIPLRVATLATGSGAAVASAQLIIEEFGVLFALQLILAFIGAGILGLFLYQNASSPGKEKILSNLAYGAFAMVLVAEVLGRFLFYATQVKIGL